MMVMLELPDTLKDLHYQVLGSSEGPFEYRDHPSVDDAVQVKGWIDGEWYRVSRDKIIFIHDSVEDLL